MRTKVIEFVRHVFFCVVIVSFSNVLAEDLTVDQLSAAYENSFSHLRTLDIVFTHGHASHWNGWQPKPKTNLYPFQHWRKSDNVERVDRLEHVGDIPVLWDPNAKRNPKEPAILKNVFIDQYTEYTDGSKLWRFRGNPDRTETVGLLEEGKGNGEIRPISHIHNVVLGNFPYYDFELVMSFNKATYSIPQILKQFNTEIVSRQQNGDQQIITTRSYLPSEKEDPRRFIQISFDSSVGYFPKQIVFPFNAAFDDADIGTQLPYYGVRDFIEYHKSEDGAFFPIKIIASQTDDINKLSELEPIGKTAALSIILNQPVDIPPLTFPPGSIITIEDNDKHTTYIWDHGNKPLKVLEESDYNAAAEQIYVGLPPRKGISPIRIFCLAAGITALLLAFLVHALNKRK